MSYTPKRVVQVTSLFIIFIAAPVGGQNNTSTDNESMNVPISLAGEQTRKILLYNKILVIEETRQKYKQSTKGINIFPSVEYSGTDKPRSSEMSQNPLFSIDKRHFQTVEPIDAAAALQDYCMQKYNTANCISTTTIEQARKSKCNSAAVKWSKYLSIIDHDYLTQTNEEIDKLTIKLKPNVRKIFNDAAKDYDAFCLHRLEHLPQDFTNTKFKNVVAFILFENMPICSALRLRKNIFVTARHCFFRKSDGEPTGANQDNVMISVLSKPDSKFSIREIFGDSAFDIKMPQRFEDQEDYLFLRTDSVKINMPSIKEMEPSEFQDLILLG